MTRRIGNIILVQPENAQQCDLCGKVDELRPYGPNGEAICFDCGMKNRAATEARMAHVLFDEPLDASPPSALPEHPA
jgi:hypothetical protein